VSVTATIPAPAQPVLGQTTSPQFGTSVTRRSQWRLWTCPNCTGQTREPRKRCAECGTSRY
jgi:hypothetical protein